MKINEAVFMEYPAWGAEDWFNENLKFRTELLLQAEQSEETKELINRLCESSPLFFFNVLAWTYNPKKVGTESGAHLPFVTYPYQDETILDIVESIENGRDVWVEKSREMGWSWVLVGVQVWGWLFKGWASLYGSYKENYVDESGNLDSNFERIRYMIERIPEWMKPEDMVSKFMSVTSKELDCGIAGDSGVNFGTGGRRKFVIMDEFPLWADAKKAIRKTRDIAETRLIGGTPEGLLNEYGKAMNGHPDYSGQDFLKVTWHWTRHPEKARGVKLAGTETKLTMDEAFAAWKNGQSVTSPWYEGEKIKRSADDLAREVDIAYKTSVRGRVYPEFESVVKIGRFPYNPNLPLYTAWDYGRDMVAILWIQWDYVNNVYYVIDCFQKKSIGQLIKFFGAFVLGMPVGNYVYTEEEQKKIASHFGWQYMQHFGDPYNANSKTIVTNRTVASELREIGINLTWITPRGKNQVADRISMVHKDLPKYCIDRDNCQIFMGAMMGCRYPKQREGSEATKEQQLPVHDDTSHFRTSLEYFVDNMAFISPPLQEVDRSSNISPEGFII